MKAALCTVVIAASSAAASFTPQQQQVLGQHRAFSALEEAQQQYGPMNEDEQRVWEYVSKEVPNAFENLDQLPPPKLFNRRSNDEWDYIVKGADVQSVWVQNENGEQERAIDGKLEDYTLRSKSIDPSKLGVDDVKQYSGYLDDDEKDKHLFYCKLSWFLL